MRAFSTSSPAVCMSMLCGGGVIHTIIHIDMQADKPLYVPVYYTGWGISYLVVTCLLLLLENF